jgi:hypothetical protein
MSVRIEKIIKDYLSECNKVWDKYEIDIRIWIEDNV